MKFLGVHTASSFKAVSDMIAKEGLQRKFINGSEISSEEHGDPPAWDTILIARCLPAGSLN